MNITHFTRSIFYFYTHFILKPKAKYIGKKSIVFAPMQIDGIQNISIGDNTFLAQYSWLCARKDIAKCNLKIGSNTTIGHFAHIVAWENVSIGNSVLIADKVFISDCTHNYKDIMTPILNQSVEIISANGTKIGDETWIGENVCIYGASIGKHCVVAANSVVNRDIPDYCVAAGSPAKIIKQYDFDLMEWK